MSGREQFLRSGLCLGVASPGLCVSEDVKGCIDDSETTDYDDVVVNANECDVECGCKTKSRVTVVTKQSQDHVGQIVAENKYVSEHGSFSHNATVGHGDGEGSHPCRSSVPSWSALTDDELFARFETDFGHLKPIMDGLPTDFNGHER